MSPPAGSLPCHWALSVSTRAKREVSFAEPFAVPSLGFKSDDLIWSRDRPLGDRQKGQQMAALASRVGLTGRPVVTAGLPSRSALPGLG